MCEDKVLIAELDQRFPGVFGRFANETSNNVNYNRCLWMNKEDVLNLRRTKIALAEEAAAAACKEEGN